MPDENVTEATRQDAVSVEESIFGELAGKADDTPSEAAEGGGRQRGGRAERAERYRKTETSPTPGNLPMPRRRTPKPQPKGTRPLNRMN